MEIEAMLKQMEQEAKEQEYNLLESFAYEF